MAKLARMRPWASTPHLALSFLRTDAPDAAPARDDVAPASPMLAIAVPKRLAPSSPVRNMIRRVLREAWRHAGLRALPRSATVLVRLRLLPGAPAPVRPAPSPSGPRPKRSAKGLSGQALLRARLTDRALKRVVRTEADRLFGDLVRMLSRAREPA